MHIANSSVLLEKMMTNVKVYRYRVIVRDYTTDSNRLHPHS